MGWIRTDQSLAKAGNMAEQPHELAPVGRCVETASATTSPDNADSGNAAYLIVAVALVVLVALGIALAGALAAVVGSQMLSEYDVSDDAVGYGDEGEGLGLEDLERLLEGYGEDGSGSSDAPTTSDELDQSEALDLGLSLYDTTVDAQVDATVYAGVPGDVRSYVRELLAADRDAAGELARLLNAAARGEDTSGNVEAAVEAAASGRTAIEAVQAPDLDDQDVADALAQARQRLLDRWDAIAAEVRLLDTEGTISYDDLEKADEDVLDATSDAAEAFVEALDAAASS